MDLDVLIIGGGINGCAIAREAALAGRSVLLIERDDLAAHTSSASTGLIHGGLRYLEYGEFRLVREALQERERLLAAAPHLIRPIRLVLPHQKGLRPWWMVRLGLWLYDHLGGRISLPGSRGLRQDDAAYRAPLLNPGSGFVYSDARVDDARLTLLNAMDAAQHGADIRTRTALVSARRQGKEWRAALSDGSEVTARHLVNAAGPWVLEILALAGISAKAMVRLVKGSHIVVPRLFDGGYGYMLQQPDRRIVFALPWQGATVLGTTEVSVDQAKNPSISVEEVGYLCGAANAAFTRQIAPTDILTTWSGVRPLYDDGASESRAITRDYVLEVDANGPPLLSVFGGKITTARRLAEQAIDKLGLSSNNNSRGAALPGGDMADVSAFLAQVRSRWSFLGDMRSDRMVRAYGTLLHDMLADVVIETDLGKPFGAGFTEIEARWMRTREWATTAEDCLTRRSRLGFHMSDVEKAAFTDWWEGETQVRVIRDQ